ncbi:MAG: nuclear transport factor 2 family protein [Gammaproteobacteria bacterium]|jgi:ketosteroid isomerase-like protein
MATTENEQLVIDFFATLSTGDLEKVRPFFHKDATWQAMARDIPGAGTHSGRDVIIDEFLGPIRGEFEPGDPKVTVKSIASKGPLVMAECKGTGRMKNGKAYDNDYCWAVEIKDGKIFAIREYMDTHYVFKLFFE